MRRAFFSSFLFIGLWPLILAAQALPVPGESQNAFSSYALTGVILAHGGQPSSGLLRNKATGKSVIISEGESLNGWVLNRVLEDGAVFKQGEKTIRMALAGAAPPAAGRMNEASDQKSLTREPVSLFSLAPPAEPNIIRREFKRADIEKRLAMEMTAIYQETRFVPHIVDNAVKGFRVTQMPRKGLITELGIQAGDILVEINGNRLADIGDMLGLYAQIKNGTSFTLVLERQGRPIQCSYSIF